MNSKKFYTLLLAMLLFSFSNAEAQSVDEIRSNPAYLCGEGIGVTVARADQAALSDLVSQIAITINTETQYKTNEYSVGDDYEYTTDFSDIIYSYSGATLTNTERLIIKNEPNAEVIRYIKKSEIDRIFDARKKLILEQVRLGEKALENFQIDNALKYYYWSFTLVKSLRYPSELDFVDSNGEKHQLLSWLPEKMDNIFKSVSFTPLCEYAESAGTYLFEITYNNQSAASLDFSYYDGAEWSAIHRTKNGASSIELRPGVSLSVVQFKCEYHFENEMHINKEIEQVMKLSEPAYFNEAYVKPAATTPIRGTLTEEELCSAENQSQIFTAAFGFTSNDEESSEQSLERSSSNTSASNTPNVTPQPIPSTAAPVPSLEAIMESKVKTMDVYEIGAGNLVSISEPDRVDGYKTILSKISFAISQKNYESVREHFTEEGYEIFEKLIKYGNAVVMPARGYSFVGINNNVEGRGMTLSFSFRNNNSKFVEEVAYTFNANKKIDNITFCLDAKAKNDIVAMSHWSESSRYLLLSFLENYKTAYALKRLDYLESIFDDDALIITGRVVYPSTQTDSGINFRGNKYVELTRQSKTEYLNGLSRVFGSNEYVNLKFANCDVQKLGVGGEIYGIQVKQDYFSTNYADAGYLFLMVDLNNPDLPTIHVRTWQEEPDSNFGIISASDF